MEKKRKKSKVRVFGVKLKDILQLATIVGGCAWAVHWFDNKFAMIDDRFERVETRLDGIDHRLDKIEVDLSKTSDLLNLYLTWRFIYVNDPARKNLMPIYDARTRTLDFVDRVKDKLVK